MGALCGKQSSSFSSPGRPLGSAPAAPSTTSRIPAAAGRHSTGAGAGQTLAGGSNATSPPEGDDPRAAAARAAEARARNNTGKLGAQLESQKKKSNQQHLAEVAAQRQPGRENLVWD
ncbi:hypothetical protein BZA77DRAFT_303522 [Pyronema omphalodes]|nr:hypothetical protein BZA77DRAFT_303522 [Pyronema omphalodes]